MYGLADLSMTSSPILCLSSFNEAIDSSAVVTSTSKADLMSFATGIPRIVSTAADYLNVEINCIPCFNHL